MEYESDDTVQTKRILRMERLREGKPPKYKDLAMDLLPEFQESIIDFSELGDIDLPPAHDSIFR